MDRSNEPITLPDTGWLSDPSVQAVCSAIAAGGGTAYFVGGCVRDALLGIDVKDIDMATDVLPRDVIDLAQAAGLKAVPTGIDHGTVTIVSGQRAIEVTTFRQDVETDGRHATVAFSGSMADDARRRDFTLNALYADCAGRIYDPLGEGLSDCLARHVRFIDDADQRIREDYLRILRFFRFHAWFAPNDAGFAPDALDAIARNTDGIETLSAERIGSEMMRLLAAPDPAPAMTALAHVGAMSRILPLADPQMLGPYVHLEMQANLRPNAIGRLAAMGDDRAPERFRLSKKNARMFCDIRDALKSDTPLVEVAYRNGSDSAFAVALCRAATIGTILDLELSDKIYEASTIKFPMKAGDLMPELEGKALGDRMRKLEQMWIESGFNLSREDLMNML